MCGIVAAVASRNVVPILIEGLKRLEYRGYDSAGVAVINGSMQRLRSCGRVAQLEKLAANLHGNIAALGQRLQTKRSRATWVRRCDIPQANGTARPLGMPRGHAYCLS